MVRAVAVLTTLTAIAVAFGAVGPFWDVVALFGLLAAVPLAGWVIERRRDR